ncbi:MAG TPA: homoserine kinase [bacterium]|nr:homoserine kinase [bacterium]
MVKKTKLNRKIITEIVKNYNLGEIDHFFLIKNGFMHSNYFIQANTGNFILRVYESRTDEQALLEAKVLEKLKNSLVPVPKIIKTKTGELFSGLGKKRVAIFSFLDGSHVADADVTISQIKSVGVNMGRLHKLLQGYKPKEVFSKPNYDNNYVKETLEEIKKKHPTFPLKIEQRVLNVLNLIRIPSLPKGVNHGDMFDDNVLFKGNKVSGVLDFDDCYYGNFLDDLGCALTYWCINEKIDYKKIKAFINAYESEKKLSRKEREFLYEETLLIALVHVVHLLMDKKNWNKSIRPLNVVNILMNTPKDEFMRSIFEDK